MIRARLRDGGTERDVCVLDVSTRGILATAPVPPLRGDFVELIIGQHRLVGHVKWASDHRFGLSLQQRVSVSALIAGDDRSISLHGTASAQVCRGGLVQALRTNSRSFGNIVQFAMMVAAGLGCAYLLANVAEQGLGSLDIAKEAMAQR